MGQKEGNMCPFERSQAAVSNKAQAASNTLATVFGCMLAASQAQRVSCHAARHAPAGLPFGAQEARRDINRRAQLT